MLLDAYITHWDDAQGKLYNTQTLAAVKRGTNTYSLYAALADMVILSPEMALCADVFNRGRRLPGRLCGNPCKHKCGLLIFREPSS